MEENWKRRKRRDFFFFQNFNNICFPMYTKEFKLSLATKMKRDLELLAFTSHLQRLHNPVYRSHFCQTWLKDLPGLSTSCLSWLARNHLCSWVNLQALSFTLQWKLQCTNLESLSRFQTNLKSKFVCSKQLFLFLLKVELLFFKFVCSDKKILELYIRGSWYSAMSFALLC